MRWRFTPALRETPAMPVLRIALDLPLHRLFDYVAPGVSTADVGYRVRVPFGRGERIGVIVEVSDSSEWPLAQLKAAGEILRDLPPLPADFLRLCEFASTYYQAPLGEVLLQALPAGLKRVAPPVRRQGRAERSQPAAPAGEVAAPVQPSTVPSTPISAPAANPSTVPQAPASSAPAPSNAESEPAKTPSQTPSTPSQGG